MRRIGVAAYAILIASSSPAALATQWEGPQAEAPETKDRLTPEAMEEMVKGPMALLKTAGLAKAQASFEALVANARKAHGTSSVEEADLLTSFGTLLYMYGLDHEDETLQRAAIPYFQRSIAADRLAFGPRHPEVALALNSYWTLIHNLQDKQLQPAADAALKEAYDIRLEALGPDNAETKATASQIAFNHNQETKAIDDALAAATAASSADAATATATAKLDGAGPVAAATDDRKLWRPEYHYNPLVDEFVDGLGRLDPKDSAARRAFAAKYGLPIASLGEAVTLLHTIGDEWFEDKLRPSMRAKALTWFGHTNRAPVALALTGAILNQISEPWCSAADFNLLMKGSRNPEADSWTLATTCRSSRALASAIDRSDNGRPALLYLAATTTSGDDAAELAAYEILLRQEFLAAVAPDQRDRVHAQLAHAKLSKLISLGLFDQALAFGDSLDPTTRRMALRPEKGEIRTAIAGFELKQSVSTDAVAEDYAAALALRGRKSDARAVLDQIAPLAKLKEVRACLDAAKDKCDVGFNGIPLGALIVDQLLDDPFGDPYVLIEAGTYGSPSHQTGVAEALCRLLNRPDEAKDCKAARDVAASEPEPLDDDDTALWAAVRRTGGPEFEAARARYAAMLSPVAPKPNKTDWSRASVDPAQVPFRERPIPAKLPARAAPAVGQLAALPKGFGLIRLERSGKRVVAISLSTRFDPNGEVSGGGYWVHISDDGGKSWGPPLYTGLAEHFPYVVPEKSRLPLIAGDRIHMEVQESLIDTASISYPPVGLHIRRKRSGLYLDIPIADLRRDSDGDGLTDIAARHLLLDTKSSAPTPFVVGRDRDCTAVSPETEARLAIVKELFQVEARALIEPPDKKAILGDWRRVQPSGKPPIFLNGNPDDWRCVTVDRPMIVYSDADRDRLRKFSPDFQLIELPPIHWNRAHTRGFVNWSMGWTGGTYRLTRKRDGWKLESISEWIT